MTVGISSVHAELTATDPNAVPAIPQAATDPAAATAPAATAAPAAAAQPAAAAPVAAAATASPAPASTPAPAATASDNKSSDEKAKTEGTNEDTPEFDFENEKAFMDVPDALRSRQFVHRAILSTIIRDTSKVALGNYYFSPMLGFDAIYQPANRGGDSFAKYVTGIFGLGFGYAGKTGNTYELDWDISGVSNLSLSYRKLFRSDTVTFWPFLGGGVGTQFSVINLSGVPVEARVYEGSTKMVFALLGAVIPLVDVAIKVETRFCFYGLDRLMLTTGIGAVFFL